MNIIFVDIDGPLLPNTMNLFTQNRATGQKVDGDNPPYFDPVAVRIFNLWAKYSNAKVVFSTNWSYSFEADVLKEMMIKNGLGFDYHTEVLTPKKMSSTRANEICWWLADNTNEGDKFIAVDDDPSCKHIATYLEGDSDTAQENKAVGKWIEVDFFSGISWPNFIEGCDALGIDRAEIDEKEFGVKRLTEHEKKVRAEALKYFI